jgi:CRP-like cAMP-binding protein
MSYNCLSDETMKQVIPHLQHKRIPKNSYIFKQGDESQYFYLIVQGKISIRVKKIEVADEKNEDDFKASKIIYI